MDDEPDSDRRPARDRLTAQVAADHAGIEQLLGELDAAAHDLARSQELVDRLITLLVEHDTATAQTLHRCARATLPDGAELADGAHSQMYDAERLMAHLRDLDPVHPSFAPLLRRIVADARAHIDQEEGQLLPRLRHVLSRADADALGARLAAFHDVEQAPRAPAEPHPGRAG